MKGKMGLADPESTQVTLEVTMSIGRWRELHEEIKDAAEPLGSESRRLRRMIVKLVNHTYRTFEERAPADDKVEYAYVKEGGEQGESDDQPV